MTPERVFSAAAYFQASEGEPIRTVVTQTPEATVVAWHLEPVQQIAAHFHPSGQDTWTILSGEGRYQLSQDGSTRAIRASDVALAPVGAVHGVLNTGTEPLRFVSVVSPADAGFELIEP
jgi:quercetin dioxygenase-like cupin family protein